jgi:esterase/lipase superfamily enzyme
MGGALTAGTLKARIDPGLKIGKVLPKKLKRKGVIGVQEVAKMDDRAFIKSLSEAVGNSPHKSLLVLVYGFKDNFELTATKAAYFAYLLDVDTPVLLLDWPGDQPVTPWGYKKAQKFAAASGPYFGELLARIIREVKPGKLWIESSSMGCQVVCDAFEWMYLQEDLSDPETEISNVVMVAPDVSEDEFDNKFKNEMEALTGELTTYVSSNDQALLMAEVIDWEKKVGRQGYKAESYDQFEEAKDLLYLKSLSPGKVSMVDMSRVNRASYGHGYDLEIPEFYDDFYMRIFEVPAHNNRRLYLIKVSENVDYWIMRGDQ